jgi:hypothetical protein
MILSLAATEAINAVAFLFPLWFRDFAPERAHRRAERERDVFRR